MGFQILVSLSIKSGYLSCQYLLKKQTNTRVRSKSWGRSSSPADERLGAIVLHCLF